MIGTMSHFLIVMGAVMYFANQDEIHDFVEDFTGMAAESIYKMNLKRRTTEYLEGYVKKKRGDSV